MLLKTHRDDVEAILAKYPLKRSAALPLLHLAQKVYGHCTDEAIREVAQIVELDPTEVRSAVGFYTLFYDRETGKHVIQICDDLPCALRGADKFVDHVCQRLKLDPNQVRHGGQTTDDGQFTVETVACLAACERAPMLQIDLNYFESLTDEQFELLLRRFSG